MSKFIIDAQTGTIIYIKDAYIVDDADLDVLDRYALDEGASDIEIGAIARRTGKPIMELLDEVS